MDFWLYHRPRIQNPRESTEPPVIRHTGGCSINLLPNRIIYSKDVKDGFFVCSRNESPLKIFFPATISHIMYSKVDQRGLRPRIPPNS